MPLRAPDACVVSSTEPPTTFAERPKHATLAHNRKVAMPSYHPAILRLASNAWPRRLPVGVQHVCSRSVSSSAVAPVPSRANSPAQNWQMGATAKAKTCNVLPEESSNDRQVVAPAAREHPNLESVSWSVMQALTTLAHPPVRAKSDLEDHQTCKFCTGLKVCARQGFVPTPSYHTTANLLCRAHINGTPSDVFSTATHHALTSLIPRNNVIVMHLVSFMGLLCPRTGHLSKCPARLSGQAQRG